MPFTNKPRLDIFKLDGPKPSVNFASKYVKPVLELIVIFASSYFEETPTGIEYVFPVITLRFKFPFIYD